MGRGESHPLRHFNDRRVPVAQLDRASAYGAECRGFESLQARHLF